MTALRALQACDISQIYPQCLPHTKLPTLNSMQYNINTAKFKQMANLNIKVNWLFIVR